MTTITGIFYGGRDERIGLFHLEYREDSKINVCFGGKKRNILFITARKSVYTLKMKVKGVDN